MTERYLAFDLGAESGRAMAATFGGERLALEEVHRFPNEALHWDVLALWREVKSGMRRFGSQHGAPAGIGLDTWGVDYALLGRDGALLENPYSHRDARTNG